MNDKEIVAKPIAKKYKRDKIFDNSYNTSNYEVDQVSEKKLEMSRSFPFIDEINFDYLSYDKLQLEYIEHFHNSRFKHKNRLQLNKRSVLIDFFMYFIDIYTDDLEAGKFTYLEFLLSFLETFNIDYTLAYSILPEKFRNQIHVDLEIHPDNKKEKLF